MIALLPALGSSPAYGAGAPASSAGRAHARSARPSRTAPLPAFGAGTAIAPRPIFLHQAPSGSRVGPLMTGRAVSSPVTLAAVGPVFRRPGPEKPAYAVSATAGGSTRSPACCSCSPPAAVTSPSPP